MVIKKEQHNRHHDQQGVTLVELMVVVAIIAIISVVIVFNYSNYGSKLTLRNLSQEIALSIRKAQTYATSVQRIDGSSGVSTNTFPSYGISFSTGNSNDLSTPGKKRFILFVDIPNPGLPGQGIGSYQTTGHGNCGTPVAGDECLEAFTISTAANIPYLCTENRPCDTTNTGTGSVDIVFHRPSPEASVCDHYNNGIGSACNSSSHVEVVIQQPDPSSNGTFNNIKTITVWSTGQISMKSEL